MLYFLVLSTAPLIILLNYGYGSGSRLCNDFVQISVTFLACIFVVLNLPFVLTNYKVRIVLTRAIPSHTLTLQPDTSQQPTPTVTAKVDEANDINPNFINYNPSYDYKNVDKTVTCGHCGDDPEPITMVGGDKFQWPATGHIIQPFSEKTAGIDIALKEATPIQAAEGGEVVYAGEELAGYGKMVLIRHQNGWVSAYANNSELMVKKSDRVKRGQTISMSGKSGNCSQPQLHFELRKGSIPINPVTHLL